MDLYQDADVEIEGDAKQFTLRADNTTNFEGKNFTAVNASIIAEARNNMPTSMLRKSLTIEASDGAKVSCVWQSQNRTGKIPGQCNPV